MLGFLSSILGGITLLLSTITDYADKLGEFVGQAVSMVVWFIGTFVIYIPAPLSVLVGLCVGIMIARLVVSLGGH